MPYCLNCGHELNENAKFCPECGNRVNGEPEMVYCRYCGEMINPEVDVCPFCGKKVKEDPVERVVYIEKEQPKKEINKWVAFFLCLFFGYLGIHKFYEKRVAMGVIYIFTFGLFGIGWIIDIFAILFKPNPYYV